MIDSTTQMLRHLIGPKIDLALILYGGPVYIKADPGQVERVIINLSVNARDAMPDGGRLEIRTSPMVLDPLHVNSFGETFFSPSDISPGEYVKMTISDTGHGISDEIRNKIFEPFFTTKGPGKGTGLGLAVVHGVMKQCEGHINVVSEANGGTTFELLFPATGESAASAIVQHSPEVKRGNETVLLVEDNDAVRNIAKIALETHGFHVLEADSGTSAIRQIKEQTSPIDLLVTDVVMPGMGGHQLVEQARTLLPDLKVLYMSGHADQPIMNDDDINAGDAFLQKPFTPLSLARKVRVVLDGRRGH